MIYTNKYFQDNVFLLAWGGALRANPIHLKQKIAREAAYLLYFGFEKEFKQAKVKAAKTLGSTFLPTNLEIALELDRIADENEGSARSEQLVQMRKDALKMMKILERYTPVLVGSVWRGTAHRRSDVDLVAYTDTPKEILVLLKANNLKILKSEWTKVNKKGKIVTSFHIYLESPSKRKIELVVRDTENTNQERKCEIFGDQIKGLTIKTLTEVLKKNPLRRFVPT